MRCAPPICMVGRSWIRSIFTLTLSTAALGAAFVAVKTATDVRKAASELPRELEAAKKEGIPTNAAELAADTPTNAAHNAAPVYEQAIQLLKKASGDEIDLGLKSASAVLEGRATGTETERFHVQLLHFGPALEKAVLGSVRINCVFSPNGSSGSGYPQLRPMTTLTRLLAARAAADHDLADLFAAVRMTDHLGQTPVLEGEQEQTIAIEAVCLAAWQVAKADPANALTCKTLLEELPGIRLDRRIGGEMQRALNAIQGLGVTPDDPLHEMVLIPGSPQMSEAYQTEVVRSFRKIHQLTVGAQKWPEIEDGLAQFEVQAKDDHTLAGHVLSVLIGPWAQTAHAARRAQERRASTIQALELLGQQQPDPAKVNDPGIA